MTGAVIPVRSFRLGKKRLSAALDENQRHRLGRALTERVVETLIGVGLTPLIVTADDEVRSWASACEITVADDPGFGLNGAAAAGVATMVDRHWLVIHSDLPLIRSADLEPILSAMDDGHDVIAPSSDGGTSVLSASGTVPFAYGEASFHRHLRRLVDPVVVVATGLLHDLDSPADLESALQHRHGRWLDGIY